MTNTIQRPHQSMVVQYHVSMIILILWADVWLMYVDMSCTYWAESQQSDAVHKDSDVFLMYWWQFYDTCVSGCLTAHCEQWQLDLNLESLIIVVIEKQLFVGQKASFDAFLLAHCHKSTAIPYFRFYFLNLFCNRYSYPGIMIKIHYTCSSQAATLKTGSQIIYTCKRVWGEIIIE